MYFDFVSRLRSLLVTSTDDNESVDQTALAVAHSLSQTSGQDRICWLCYVSESEQDDANRYGWSQPCLCRGGCGWIHTYCLHRVVDDSQKGDLSLPVNCKVCGFQYVISYPEPNLLLRGIGLVRKVWEHSAGHASAGICALWLLWCASSFGAVALMQVMGIDVALDFIAETDAVLLLIGLPSIPMVLLSIELIRFEEALLHLWRKYVFRLSVVRRLCGLSTIQLRDPRLWEPKPDLSSVAQIFCSAVFLPSIASVTGSLFFAHIQTAWKRSLMGGAAFIAAKSSINAYYKESTYLRACQRKVIDYTGSKEEI